MKRPMKILGLTVLVAAGLLAGGVLLLRHFAQPLDWPYMENPQGPMLSLLNSQWTSEDGMWSAEIDTTVHPCTLYLRDQQDLVYSGGFTFDFNQYESDLNDRTELDLDDKQFKSEDGNVSSTIESLYVENGRMYLDITVSKEGDDSVRQQIVLDRKEEGEPTGTGAENIKEVSEMAELVEFSWHQGAMSYDYCFDFEIRTTEGEPALPRLRCDYTDPESGERIKLGEKAIGFQGMGMAIMPRDGEEQADYMRRVIEDLGKRELQEAETWPIVPTERWEELAEFLRKTELRAYSPPPPGLLDATDSCISVAWREGGERFSKNYSGFYADGLLELLQDIAKEVNSPNLEPVEEPLDGGGMVNYLGMVFHTVKGIWRGDDGRWEVTVTGEAVYEVHVAVSLDAKVAWECDLNLVPMYVGAYPNPETDLLAAWEAGSLMVARPIAESLPAPLTLPRPDGTTVLGELTGLVHRQETAEDSGAMHLTVRLEDGSEETVTLTKAAESELEKPLDGDRQEGG